MKKYLVSFIALLVLVTVLAIPAQAADGSVTVSPATGASGEAVTVTISLSGFEQANTVALEWTGLSAADGKWKLDGGKLDVVEANRAAWTVVDACNINGEVLELTFRVPELTGSQKVFSVSYKVQLLHNAAVVGEATATGTVTVNNPAQSVTLDKSTLALDLCGTKTATLSAAVAPDNTTDTLVTWSSSDASVASVANGVVTAVKPGTATITAAAGTKSATCVVTVSCSHVNAVKTEAKVPTCQAGGNNAYYTCGDCNQILAADKSTVTTVEAQNLAKLSHSFATVWSTDANQHWHICTSCNTEKSGLANHSFQWKVDTAATEDATGLKHEECVCGRKRSEGTVIPKLDHTHKDIKKHEAVPATCVKAGTVTYWTCGSSKCAGKYYGDAKCQLQLTGITEAINPKNHAGKTELRGKVEATCSKEGYTGDTYCLDCKTVSKQGAVVPATGKHTPKAAYLTDEKSHWQECSVCNALVGSKTAHSFKWVVDKAATEAATGLKHEACSVCKTVRSKDTVIEKLPHIPAKVEAKEATCAEAGVVEHFYCPNCDGYFASAEGKAGTAIKQEDVVIPALEHSFGTEWESDEKGHWHVCAACSAPSEAEAHTTELVGAVEASQTAEGYTGDQVCTVCQSVLEQGQTIPVVSVEDTADAEKPGTAVPQDSTGLVIATSVLALAAIGGGAFLIVKKPWKK